MFRGILCRIRRFNYSQVKKYSVMSVESAPSKRPLSPPPSSGENVAVKRQQVKRVKKNKRRYNNKEVDPTSPFGVLNFEIAEVLKEHGLTLEQITNPMRDILNDNEIKAKYNRVVSDVRLLRHASNGECIALIEAPKVEASKQTHQIVLVPFGIPGEVCTVNIHKSHPHFCESDLYEIQEQSSQRDNNLIKCKYFGSCSGCQYQAVSYEQQLEFKRQTVVNAYRFLAPELNKLGRLPEIGETVGSPMQYGYRTKLTPHFDLPRSGLKPGAERPNIGFGMKGRPKWRPLPAGTKAGAVMDIEECVIGTPIVNIGMKNERSRFEKNYLSYKRGATILLRENTRTESDQLEEGSKDASGEISVLKEDNMTYGQVLKTCVTNNGQIVKEVVEGYQFEFVANEFFQNNNSILTKILAHVRKSLQLNEKSENYLIDAYCGSGLFSVTSASSVERVVGVEISEESVKFAKRNAELNGVENASFIQGKAEKIFEGINLPHDKTSIILDPPRKGCDEIFLKQLAEFNPKRVIYISCNVHSQARDLEYFLTKTENGAKFKVDSIKGFDFFPQTHHVEGVAVISRHD